MIEKAFPRKEFYIHNTKKPLNSSLVRALYDRNLKINNFLKEYSESKWELENQGGISSRISSIIDIDSNKNEMILHCGVSEYKYLLGMVKLAHEKRESDTHGIIHGLSTEIMPIFNDEIIVFEQRQGNATQHGAGFYDIPTASQNAEFYINKANQLKEGLVKNIFDMTGFPKYHILKAFPKISLYKIKEIFYTGFSRGFEVSLDTQVNGYTNINLDIQSIEDKLENRLYYKLSDLLSVLDSIGEIIKKEDIYGKKPKENHQTGKFAIIDDCLGTLLSYIYHKKYDIYDSALEILENKGYKINEVCKNRIALDDLI